MDKDRILWLLEHGADVNTMHEATIKPRSLRTRWDDGILRHPLDYAASTARTDIFQLLLDRGATIAKSNPLHIITGCRNTEPDADKFKMLDYLLDKLGMNVNTIEYSQDEDAMDQFKKLRDSLQRGLGVRPFGTPLHKAAGWGWLEGVEYLLKRGADKSILDTEKHTALDWAKMNDVNDGSYNQKVVDLLSKP